MSPNVFEPRRLRESPERSSSIEGRLARQLRVLSAYAPTPQLRRYSALPRKKRTMLMAIRVAAVAMIVLAVSGAATAMATYAVRRVWSRPTAVGGLESPASSPTRKRGGRTWVQPPQVESPTETTETPSRGSEFDIPALSAETATAASEHPAMPPRGRSRSIAARQLARQASAPYRSPEESPKAPPAQTVEPPQSPWPPLLTGPSPTVASPSGPLPTGATTSPSPSGQVTSQVRADGVTQEAELLRRALAALRRDHDAKRALILLDDYDRRFGRGTLAQEADSARAQALLQIGDTPRALAILDRLPLGHQGHPGELQVIRGELRSLSGRCRDALLDFDAVLRATAGSAPIEVARALFGRASCRARTGDPVGAEADRQRYLKEFPQGPAARQLSSPP
jgi:hypothetical protein